MTKRPKENSGFFAMISTDHKTGGTNGKLRRKPIDLSYAKVPQGQVYVLSERCKECRFCVEFCPRGMLELSAEINAKGFHYPVVREGSETDCIHCGFCRLVCPEFAIYTEEVTQDGVE